MVDISILHDIQSQLRELDIDQVAEILSPLFVAFEIETPTIPAGTVLFRGRVLKGSFKKESGIKIADLSYPPREFAKMGRVNRENRPFYYCSASQEVVYFELPGLTMGDEIVLSYWRTKDDILVNNIGYTQFLFEKLGAKRTIPTWSGNEPSHTEVKIPDEESVKAALTPFITYGENSQVREALSHAIMSEVREDEQFKYKLTVAIAERYLGEIVDHPMQFAGILYPTVRMMANGDNLALKSEYVDSHLQFFKARHIRIDDKIGTRVSFSTLDFADSLTDDGLLSWKGRSEAFSLPPGDSATFIFVEGEMKMETS